MSDTVRMMQSRFPNIYNVYDENTIIYTLLRIYADRMDNNTSIIDRINNMIDIDSTSNEDLEHRWGSMLGIYRMNGESYFNYRSRLKIAYPSLAGGTAHAIKYAIASTIGVSDQETIDKCIFVYDAWLYDREIPDNIIVDQSYGNIVCVVDLAYSTMNIDIQDRVLESINKVKASGINAFIIFIYTTEDDILININDKDIMNINCNPNNDNVSIVSMGEQEPDTALFGSGLFGSAIFGKCTHASDYFEDIITYHTVSQ